MYQQAVQVANAAPVVLTSATENLRENSMRRYFWLALTALPLLLPAAARADDVSDSIKEALRAYAAEVSDSIVSRSADRLRRRCLYTAHGRAAARHEGATHLASTDFLVAP